MNPPLPPNPYGGEAEGGQEEALQQNNGEEHHIQEPNKSLRINENDTKLNERNFTLLFSCSSNFLFQQIAYFFPKKVHFVL